MTAEKEMSPANDHIRHAPLVSVIMPFYNAETFIRESIESVIHQTYQNWELLLVDDGSQDSSTAIAMEFAREDPGRIHYLKHSNRQNLGYKKSINRAISEAGGEFIAPLDADDVWLENKLMDQVEIMSNQPRAAMVFSSSTYWYSWTGNPEDLRNDYRPKSQLQKNQLYTAPYLFISFFLRQSIPSPCPCNVLLRSNVLSQVGGLEEAVPAVCSDQSLFAKICLKEAVYFSGQKWDKYRQHSESMCAKSGESGQIDARFVFLTWLKSYLIEHRVDDEAVFKAMNRAFWPYRNRPLFSFYFFLKNLIPLRWRKWLWRIWSEKIAMQSEHVAGAG